MRRVPRAPARQLGVAISLAACCSYPGVAQTQPLAPPAAPPSGSAARPTAPALHSSAAASGIASAQLSLPSVSVTGPSACPDASALAAEVNRADGRQRLRVGPSDYRVEFSSWGAGFDALIRDRHGRVRSLAGDSGDCMELGRAVALTLLVLLDQPLRDPERPPRHVQQPPGGSEPPPTESRVETERGWRSVVGVQAGVSTLLPRAAPLISGYVGLRLPVDAEVWVAASTDVRVQHGPGRVEFDWFGAGARACLPLLEPLSACGGALLSRLRAAGTGYDDFNQRVTRWQPAVDAGLKLQAVWRETLEGRLGLQGELPLARERFTVSGVEGVAFETPLVGVVLFAGLGARF